MNELKITHLQETAHQCCGNADNLEPVLIRLNATCGFTHFCKECGWVGLSDLSTLDGETLKGSNNQLEFIENVVNKKTGYIAYPLVGMKEQPKLGSLDFLTKKKCIPFMKIDNESNTTKKTKRATTKK